MGENRQGQGACLTGSKGGGILVVSAGMPVWLHLYTTMSSIHIKHHHSLTRDETRVRVERVAEYLRGKYRVNYAWKGYQLSSKHKGAHLHVKLTDGCVELKIQLGMLYAPFKGRIERAIRTNLHSVIGDEKSAPSKMKLHEKV